jgi:peroxiredoxin Q/BCP
MPEMPQPGDAAPDFAGPTADGQTVRLADFAGRSLLLYFYPKDDTPGCTKQACNLRDGLGTMDEHGIAVVGVSPDGKEAHARFAEKYDLPFPLLADPEHEILNAYGVWGERSLYGRKVVGVKRTSFLIDGDGTVRHVFKRPKTADHTQEVLKKAAAIGLAG